MKVKKLNNTLRGHISFVKLLHVLAAVVTLGTGCPAPETVEPITPVFGASQLNPFGLTDVGRNASPRFVDIDHDGDLDAFVGEALAGVLFFRNTGTPTAPAFAAPETNPFGLTAHDPDIFDFNYSPDFVDIDHDGDLDAFVEVDVYSMSFFRNTGTASVPAFAAAETNPFGLSSAGGCNNPCFQDMDNDGDFDVIFGELGGSHYYLQNTGTATAPAFEAPLTNPYGLTDVGFYSVHELKDIDRDGDFDALVGEESGNIVFFENTGSRLSPAFAAAVWNPFGLADTGSRSTPCFVDIDDDGDLDAFVGVGDGTMIYFENTAL